MKEKNSFRWKLHRLAHQMPHTAKRWKKNQQLKIIGLCALHVYDDFVQQPQRQQQQYSITAGLAVRERNKKKKDRIHTQAHWLHLLCPAVWVFVRFPWKKDENWNKTAKKQKSRIVRLFCGCAAASSNRNENPTKNAFYVILNVVCSCLFRQFARHHIIRIRMFSNWYFSTNEASERAYMKWIEWFPNCGFKWAFLSFCLCAHKTKFAYFSFDDSHNMWTCCFHICLK